MDIGTITAVRECNSGNVVNVFKGAELDFLISALFFGISFSENKVSGLVVFIWECEAIGEHGREFDMLIAKSLESIGLIFF